MCVNTLVYHVSGEPTFSSYLNQQGRIDGGVRYARTSLLNPRFDTIVARNSARDGVLTEFYFAGTIPTL